MFKDNVASLILSGLDKGDKPIDLLINRPAGDWTKKETEGQLSVDILNTPEELIVIATMAGTNPEKIELHLHNDFLTIRGDRRSPAPEGGEYYSAECFWGPFSRTIVLPSDVAAELSRAEYKNGVLVIKLPKKKITSAIPIVVIEE